MSGNLKLDSCKNAELRKMLEEGYVYKSEIKKPLFETLPKVKNYARVGIDADKPMVALTFDDGPGEETGRLLEIFRKNGGKATFFIEGSCINDNAEMVKTLFDEGHQVANHSWDHKNFTELKEKAIKDQILMTRAKIIEVTGEDCVFVRPPFGAYNDIVKSVGEDINVCFINWSVDSLDYKTGDADAVYNEIINNVSAGDIVHCHDCRKETADAMEKLVPELIAKGYQLVTVSQLMKYSSDKLKSGGIYFKK